jgi:hypothetical protein
MTQAYVLDTGVLSAITHPAATPANVRCLEWLVSALSRGITVVIPFKKYMKSVRWPK